MKTKPNTANLVHTLASLLWTYMMYIAGHEGQGSCGSEVQIRSGPTPLLQLHRI